MKLLRFMFWLTGSVTFQVISTGGWCHHTTLEWFKIPISLGASSSHFIQSYGDVKSITLYKRGRGQHRLEKSNIRDQLYFHERESYSVFLCKTSLKEVYGYIPLNIDYSIHLNKRVS